MSIIKGLKPIALACSLALLATACSENTSSNSGPNFGDKDPGNGGGTAFDEKALLANLVDNVMTPTFELFADKAGQDLAPAIANYCQLEKSNDADRDSSLANAQAKWVDAMHVWQHSELMQVGPLLSNDGQLRNVIYSWPAKSLCGVDQDVVYFQDGVINLNPNAPYDIKARTATRRGLVALEHLLFNPNLDHNCSIANDALQTWNERPDHDRKVARCEYAVAVANDLFDNANALLAQWNGDTGFANEIKNAGEPGNQFESTHKAVNAISDALFYLDKELKDSKLATPLGYFSNSCGLEACPEDVESALSSNSLANIRANIEAFEMLFTGRGVDQAESGIGFDDYLSEEEASETAQLMTQGLVEAKQSVAAITGTLQSALVENKASVEQSHTKVKEVTDQLKTDFINKLALELPKSSAGDND